MFRPSVIIFIEFYCENPKRKVSSFIKVYERYRIVQSNIWINPRLCFSKPLANRNKLLNYDPLFHIQHKFTLHINNVIFYQIKTVSLAVSGRRLMH